MLNSYGERTLPCHVPRVTQNDFFSMGTIKSVVTNVGTHALDNITVYSDASSEHSNEGLP